MCHCCQPTLQLHNHNHHPRYRHQLHLDVGPQTPHPHDYSHHLIHGHHHIHLTTLLIPMITVTSTVTSLTLHWAAPISLRSPTETSSWGSPPWRWDHHRHHHHHHYHHWQKNLPSSLQQAFPPDDPHENNYPISHLIQMCAFSTTKAKLIIPIFSQYSTTQNTGRDLN